VRVCSSPGLVQLVRARNITTVGAMSSLTCKQVQTLPIKSPKIHTLKSALTAFSKKLQVKGGVERLVRNGCEVIQHGKMMLHG